MALPELVASFYGQVLSRPKRYVKAMEVRTFCLQQVLLITRGAENAGELLSEAFGKLGYQFILSNFVALNVLENIVVDKFAQNNPLVLYSTVEGKRKHLFKELFNVPIPGIFPIVNEEGIPTVDRRHMWYPPIDVQSQGVKALMEIGQLAKNISLKGES